MAWQWEQNGRVAKLIHEGLDFKNRISEQVDEESIKAKSKNEYKKWVNNKVRKAAFNANIEEKNMLSNF